MKCTDRWPYFPEQCCGVQYRKRVEMAAIKSSLDGCWRPSTDRTCDVLDHRRVGVTKHTYEHIPIFDKAP